MREITEIAYEKARAVLESACSPLGLMASPEGYPHVWARDSAITALGAGLLPDHEPCLRAALETLAGQQSELGAIPNNVNLATGRLDHTNAGAGEAPLLLALRRLPRLWRLLRRVRQPAGNPVRCCHAYHCVGRGRVPVFDGEAGW